MPIGTSNTATTYKVTKPVRIPIKQQEDDFLKELFKFLGIQVLALALSAITGGVASAIGLGAGLSNFASAFISFGVETATDFAVNQIYDKLTYGITAKSTALNLLPAIGGIGKLTRGYRTTKILKLAENTKLLEKLGVKTAKNLEDIVRQLSGKKILTSEKLLFNFPKNTSNETIIYSLGQLARKDFYTGFKKYSFNQLNNLLKIEKNIQKISPNLIQKLPRLKENQANKILSQFGLNINQVTKISTDEWYSVMNKLYKKGLGKNLILYVNSVRTTKIFNNKVINFLGNTSQKINKLLNYVNPNFYIKKATKKLFAPLEKRIVAIKQKIISQVHNKLQKLYSKFEIKAIQKGQLLPFAFGSDVFLAVRIEPLSIVGEVVLTIYYKNPNYEPIVIMTTAVKAEKFVLAKEPFVYYMHSEWFIGWGTETGGLFNLVPLAPEPIRKIVFDSFKIYHTIAKVLKFKEQIKTNFNKDRFKKSFEESVFQSLLGGGLLFQSYKLIREKRSFKKYAKKKGLSNSKKYITNKIYSKKNKW